MDTKSRPVAIQIPRTPEGLAAKETINRVVLATRATPAQEIFSKRAMLTTYIVLAHVFEYAIEQAGGVEALGAIVTERNAHDQAITHDAKLNGTKDGK